MFGREPVVISTALSVAIKAILLATMAFGFNITADQLAAVMFAADSILGLALVLIVRPQTVPLEKSDALVEKALTMPATASISQVVAAEKKDYDKANV